MPSTDTPAPERAHAKRSPSAYKYIKACPGYLPQKNQELHPNTIRGTKIHDAIEANNFDLLDDQELRWAEYCLGEKQKALAEVFGTNPYDEEKEIKVVVIEKFQSWGYLDSFLMSRVTGILMDWKFGWGEVDDARKNEQMKGYTVALFKKYPTLQTLHVYVVQPPLRKTTSKVYTRSKASTMKAAITRYLKKGWQCDANPKKYLTLYANPETNRCLYCQRSQDLSCPIMSTALKRMQENVDKITFPSKFDPENFIATPAELVQILQSKEIITKIFDAAAEKAKELLESGIILKGLELQHVEGRTTVSNPSLAHQVCAGMGITDAEFQNCMSVSLTDLKTVVKTKAPRGQKELAVEQFVAKLSEADAIKQGEPSTRIKILK